MRVLHVTSEAFPLVKTGGLADVTTGLSRAIIAEGDEVRVLMPAYRGCAMQADATPLCDLGDPLGIGPTRLLAGVLPHTGVPVWLVDCPPLYDRPGGPYLDDNGRDWQDNHLRFGLLSRVAALLGVSGALVGWAPDVVHCHDWQAGLAAAHLSLWGGRRPVTVFTVHNLQFHGRFEARHLESLGLPRHTFDTFGLEFYGAASFLKAGLFYADGLTTVSPTYAEEIQTERGGEGLHGLLSSRRTDLIGILNGIDDQLWDPRRDPFLRRTYGVDSLVDKREDKLVFQEEMRLVPDASAPLLGWVGRLTSQKGIDLVLHVLHHVLERGAQLAVIGTGEHELEQAVQRAASHHTGRVAFFRGYSEALSHRLIAGSDALLVPSRFEPCGLTQMYAMRYGTIPIARETGGLKDTVSDATTPEGTGFTFRAPTAESLGDAIHRAISAFGNQGLWTALQQRGMHRSMGWGRAAGEYRSLYHKLVESPRRPPPVPGYLRARFGLRGP